MDAWLTCIKPHEKFQHHPETEFQKVNTCLIDDYICLKNQFEAEKEGGILKTFLNTV